MVVSAAKLEANRRNAARSCGPRTEAGKSVSKLNAVKHGMRAATLVLLDEDAQALDDRKADWAASLMPRGAAEQRIVDDAVEYTWLRDRARRAQEARLATNIVNAGVDEAIREADEVLRLGQKLFWDNRGPLANYPHYDMQEDGNPECVPLVSESDLAADPEDPQRLVLHLQATAGGCQWMLDRWSELRSILEEGLNWQSADKLKAVRLLGRHPIEAVDDRNVLMIFIACQAIESRTGIEIPEIWNELREYERKPYAQRLIGRGIEKLRPKDAAAARLALYAIIDRATAQIELKAEAHRGRAEINGSLAADRLAFDDSPEAERLRRFDLACGRGLARSLDSLLKLRRAPELVDCPSSVLPGPLSAAGDMLESSATPNETNEPTDACENVTNEPTDAFQRDRKVLKRSRIKIKSRIKNEDRRPTVDREIVANEPTDAREDVTNERTGAVAVGLESPTYMDTTKQNSTNEPTDAREDVTNERTCTVAVRLESPTYMDTTKQNSTNEPTDARENVTNEPTVDRANMTNEPTVGREIVSNGPLLAADVRLESLTYTNAQEQNSTIEPTLATPFDGSQVADRYLGREQEQSFRTGGRGSARAGTGCEEAQAELRPPETFTTREEAQAELRPPENGTNPPARGITADTNHGDDNDSHEEIDRQKSRDWVRAALARMVALRPDGPRELNDEIRTEAQAANAVRRARLDWHKNGRHANRPKKRATGA